MQLYELEPGSLFRFTREIETFTPDEILYKSSKESFQDLYLEHDWWIDCKWHLGQEEVILVGEQVMIEHAPQGTLRSYLKDMTSEMKNLIEEFGLDAEIIELGGDYDSPPSYCVRKYYE